MKKLSSVKELSEQVFKYLLPDESSLKTEFVNPVKLAELADAYYLSNSEVYLIWFYVRLLSSLNVIDKKRMQSIASAIRITKFFDDATLNFIREKELDNKLTTKQVLTDIPQEILKDITGFIVSFIKKNLATKENLDGLDSIIYQHPTDRTTLNALKKIPGLGKVVSKTVDFMMRAEEVRLLSSSVLITENSMPDVYSVYLEVCKRLNVTNIPPIYLEQGSINAYTTGVDKPYIVISSMAVTLLNKNELSFILGHELGHIMCKHVKYQCLARWITGGASRGLFIIPGLGKLLDAVSGATLGTALFAWGRRSEYSADRAGLLACQDVDTAVRVSMKMAGYPPSHFGVINQKSFIEQMMRYRSDLDKSFWDRMRVLNDILDNTHPFMVNRVGHLLEWVADGSYDEIVDSTPEMRIKRKNTIAEDPQEAELSSKILSSLIDWSSREFGVPKRTAGKLLRSAIYGDEGLAESKLSGILQIELIIKQISINDLKYELILIVNKKGKSKKITIKLLLEDTTMDSLSKEVKNYFIENQKKQYINLLYKIKRK